MSQANVEWPVIRGAVTIFVLSLVISGVLFGFTYYFRGEMESNFIQNKQQFQDISRKYLAVDQEESHIRDYYPAFVELYDRGIIGREHRLNWIEVLRSSGKKIKLPSLDYNIGSQTEYTSEFPITLGSYKLFKSRMELTLKLLHEGDLLQLIELLNNNATGLYSISECELRREKDEIKRDINVANIFAECSLDWYSIKKFDGTDLSTSS